MLRAANRTVVAQYFSALKNLRLSQVSLVLKAGFDPNMLVNARGHNGLQFLVNYFNAIDAHFRLEVPYNRSAYLAIARVLLDSGLNANAIDMLTGEPVLFAAIKYDDVDIVALLARYVDFSVRDKDGAETALMCAARFGSKTVMQVLLEHLHSIGMDLYFLRQRNRFGLTALDLARTENLNAAKVLTKHLISLDLSDADIGAAAVAKSRFRRSSKFALELGDTAVGAEHPTAAAAYDDRDFNDLLFDGEPLDGAPAHGGVAGVAKSAVLRSRYGATTASGVGAAGALGGPTSRTAVARKFILDAQDSLVSHATSDDEDALGVAGGAQRGVAGFYAGGGLGGLTRSRSCAFLNAASSSAAAASANNGNSSATSYGLGAGFETNAQVAAARRSTLKNSRR